MAESRPGRARRRLDVHLVELGLAETRARAQALILAGDVLVDERPVDKAGRLVAADAVVRVRGGDTLVYVSRGGLKLRGALDQFAALDVAGRVAVDVGASTGGFTDCLLKAGVARVHAVDVGYGQLDWRLRNDPRVVIRDRTNVRDLSPLALGSDVELAVIDCSFISLDKVLGPTLGLLARPADVVALIKPQFEVGRASVGKGGIVRDEGARREAIERVCAHARSLGLTERGLVDASITGRDGNRECLAWWSVAAFEPTV